MDKRTINFNLTTGQNKIKLFTLHPKKPWIAIITINNTFSLWNYEQKILIKSFNCNTLDQTNSVDIKQLIFYDKHCLCYQNEALSQMKSNIIFSSNFKIFFYDYITDGIKQINQNQIQKKIIKTICPYSESKIGIGLSDGSMKIYDNRDLMKNSMMTKTIRGYHTKPITHLFTYCQNTNQTPRVVSVSVSDGLMACWNVETILSNNQINNQVFSPSFKFQRQKGPKPEQIKCFKFDRQNSRILTLSENWISLWSTMTGLEVKLLKNTYKFKQILFFNHFSYGVNTFLALNSGSSIQIVKMCSNGELKISDQINLKSLIKQHNDTSIVTIKNNPCTPSEITIQTMSGLLVLEITRCPLCPYGFSPHFSTNLSTINSREFIIKGQSRISPQINPSQIKNIKFQSDILFNMFYLSVDSEWTYYHLVEMQIDNVIHQHRKFKFFKIEPNSLLASTEGTQTVVNVAQDGKTFFLFNKAYSYYEIYSLVEQPDSQNLLEISEQSQSLDFYSKFNMVAQGFCRDIVWHQYKKQFAAICAFDKNNQMITYKFLKERKAASKPIDKLKTQLSGQMDHWCACIFLPCKNSSEYMLIEQSKPIKTQIYRIINMGALYGYSSQDKGTTETIQCFSQDSTLLKEIQGTGFFPLLVFVSYCETYQIFIYDNYFIVSKLQENGYYGYHLTIHQKVVQGMFWEKFFIFATKSQLYFLQITNLSKNLIKLGDTSSCIISQRNKSFFKSQYIDDIQSQLVLMPQGQLQFLSIINLHLLVINQNQNISLIPLSKNPYIQFCIQIACGNTEKLYSFYNRSSEQVRRLMKETMGEYGVTMTDNHSQEQQDTYGNFGLF